MGPAILTPATLAVVGLFSAAAWRLRWLTRRGAAAAWAVGSAVLASGGVWWLVVLAAFFATGTGLSHVGRDRKTQPEHLGEGRNAAQVLGAGGVGALIALLWGAFPMPDPLRVVLYSAFLGSLAAAAADTWATEIGMLSSAPPRLLTSGRPVPPGTSGGITLLGTTAGVAGAALVTGVGLAGVGLPGAGLSGMSRVGGPAFFAAITAAGTAAMLLDSLLGATLQATFRRADGSVTEDPGEGTTLIRGIAWLTNPVVNLVATTAGAVAAGLLAAWMGR